MGKYDSVRVVKDFDLDNCSEGVVCFNGVRENIADKENSEEKLRFAMRQLHFVIDKIYQYGIVRNGLDVGRAVAQYSGMIIDVASRHKIPYAPQYVSITLDSYLDTTSSDEERAKKYGETIGGRFKLAIKMHNEAMKLTERFKEVADVCE